MALAKGLIIEPDIIPLNLDKVLGKPRNRVARIGVELEGGWTKVPTGARLDTDTSVFGANAGLPQPVGHKCGELPIGPMQVAQLSLAMKKYYPHLVDKTCGMHVHMSFDTIYKSGLVLYNILADSPVYQETMMEYLLRWAKDERFPVDHHIWPRLKGQNVYCQKKFWPQEQIDQSRKDHDKERYGHRYTAIHYCWQRTGTIECRLLPMMETVEQAIRAVRKVVDITNAYLLLAKKDKVRVGGKVEINLKSRNIYDERGKTYVKKVLENEDAYEEFIDAEL